MGAGLWAFFLQSLKKILKKGWHKNLAKRKGNRHIAEEHVLSTIGPRIQTILI
jgi:hypothetical protein